MMNNIFIKNSTTVTVKYDNYEWRETDSGELFLVPSADSDLVIFDPLEDVERLVLDTAAASVRCFRKRNSKKVLMNTIRAYVCKYGLLGIINALPSTWEFAKHDRVFLPKNLFFRDEVMDTPEYIDKFFPFEKHVFKIRDDKPEYATGVSLPTLKEYGEKYDWLEKVFKDWGAVILCTSTYAQDMWDMDKDELELLRAGVAAFEENAPTYHIYLEEGPRLMWDFHSLLTLAQMMFSISLTDSDHPLRLCERCMKPYFAKDEDDRYCSETCREASISE